MAFRTPDTVPNERTTKGEQPYKRDREELAQQEAAVHTRAEVPGESQQEHSKGDTRARMESDAEARFEEIQQDHSDG